MYDSTTVASASQFNHSQTQTTMEIPATHVQRDCAESYGLNAHIYMEALSPAHTSVIRIFLGEAALNNSTLLILKLLCTRL